MAQRAPNRPKSTPTGPPTTSNCSRMSCSHHHHAEVLAQGLASLSTLHVSQKPMRKKASHNRCSTIARGSGAFDTVWPSAKNLVPPGHGSPQKTRPRMCAVVLGKIKLARIRSNPDPPDKRHLTRRNADRCPVGVVWGPVGGWFVAQRAPNRPKSTLQPPIAAA